MARRAGIARQLGDEATAKHVAVEGLRLQEAAGDDSGIWYTRLTLGEACVALGELEEARTIYQHSMKLADRYAGDLENNFRGHINRCLALVDLLDGKLEQALGYAHQPLEHANRIPDYNIIASRRGLVPAPPAHQAHPIPAAPSAGAA